MTTPAKQTSAQFAPLGTVSAPADWNIPSNIVLSPSIVFAHFDGTSAAGSFVPTLQILSDSGHVVAEIPQDVTIAAGSSCEATWAPFLRTQPASGGVIPSPGSVVGFDAYAIYTGGQSGSFVLPTTAKVVYAVLVGAGGGGGGGRFSGSDAIGESGGAGGGGGGTIVGWMDAARLKALYPSGVAYSVAIGGAGGAAGVNGANGSGQTTFGFLKAGCGGGGRLGDNSDQLLLGGSGGGITNANLEQVGEPFIDASVPIGGSFAAKQRGPGTNPQATEYGGAAGGTRAAGNLPAPGQEGGSSMWGGSGGGGGGGWPSGGGTLQHGGKGGTAATYPANSSASGNGANAAGAFVGPWAGSAGDGGDGQNGAAGLAHNGGNGSVGAGGGGGGGAGAGTAGMGGNGGDGRIYIYLFG